MHEMYPEWGPAQHRQDDEGSRSARAGVRAAHEWRDVAWERPDDN